MKTDVMKLENFFNESSSQSSQSNNNFLGATYLYSSSFKVNYLLLCLCNHTWYAEKMMFKHHGNDLFPSLT